MVIVDEFHHAEAPTYARLLAHLQPQVLLGLTATPERSDGSDVRQLVRRPHGRRAAAVGGAGTAAAGARSSTSASTTTSTCRRSVEARPGLRRAELGNLYTGHDARARLILRAVQDKVDVRGCGRSGFCVSIDHAEFMARVLRRARRAGARRVTSRDAAAADREAMAATRRRARGASSSPSTCSTRASTSRRSTRSVAAADRERDDLPAAARPRPAPGRRQAVPDRARLHRRAARRVPVRPALPGADRHAAAGHSSAKSSDDFPTLPRRLPHRSSTGSPRSRPRQPPQLVAHAEVRRLAAELRSDSATSASASSSPKPAWRSRTSIAAGHSAAGPVCAVAPDCARPTPGRRTPSSRSAIGRMLHVDDPTGWTSSTLVAGRAADVDARRDAALRPVGLDGGESATLDVDLSQPLRSTRRERRAGAAGRRAHGRIRRVTDHSPRPAAVPLRSTPGTAATRRAAAFGFTDPRHVRAKGVKWLRDEQADIFFVTLNKTERHYSPTTMYEDRAITPELFQWESQTHDRRRVSRPASATSTTRARLDRPPVRARDEGGRRRDLRRPPTCTPGR